MQQITKQKQLEKFCNELGNQQDIGIDTEFSQNRKNNYFPKLSLIQISHTPSGIQQFTIIDCLSSEIVDYTPLAKIFANDAICKIFHSGMNDIPLLEYYLDCEISNIFDTQYAYSMTKCLQNPINYKDLTLELQGVEINKDLQSSNWMQRPITNQMLKYAKIDVEYLIDSKNKLTSILMNSGKYDIFSQDMKNMRQILDDKILFSSKKIEIQGKSCLENTRIAILGTARELYAKKVNKNPKNVISDQKCLEIITENYENIKKIINIPEIILQIDQNSWDKDNIIYTPFTSEHISEYNRIKKQIKHYILQSSEKANISKSIFASSNEIELITKYLLFKQDLKQLNIKLFRGWRMELIGNDIINLQK